MFNYIYNTFMVITAFVGVYLCIDCMVLTQSTVNAHKINITRSSEFNNNRAPAVVLSNYNSN